MTNLQRDLELAKVDGNTLNLNVDSREILPSLDYEGEQMPRPHLYQQSIEQFMVNMNRNYLQIYGKRIV